MTLIETIQQNLRVFHKVLAVPTTESKTGIYFVKGGGVYVVVNDPAIPEMKLVEKIYERADHYFKGETNVLLQSQKDILDAADALLQTQINNLQPLNTKKAYLTKAAADADTNPIGDDGTAIGLGQLVVVTSDATTSLNGLYRLKLLTSGVPTWEYVGMMGDVSQKADHGYTGTPKTLKEVDDSLSIELNDIKNKVLPNYMNIGSMEYRDDSLDENIKISSYKIEDRRADQVTFKSKGFTVYFNKTYYAVRGITDITFKQTAGTRMYLWLDISKLVAYNVSPNSVSWDEVPGIFVVTTDATNLSDNMNNKLCLFSWYQNKLTGFGFFDRLVAEYNVRRLNFVRSGAYFDVTDGDLPKTAVVASDYSTITFPIGLTVLDNNTEYRTISEQVVPFICINPLDGTFADSSIGYFFLNKTTREIKQFWWRALDAVDAFEWICFGVLKRSSTSSTVPGVIIQLEGFNYKIQGAISDTKQINIGISDSLGDGTNNFAFSKGKVVINSAGFSLYIDGIRYRISGGGVDGNDLVLERKPNAWITNYWINIDLLKSNETVNWNEEDLFTYTINDFTTNDLKDKVLFLSFYNDEPQPIGVISSLVAKYSFSPLTLRQSFCGMDSSGSKANEVLVIPSCNKIIFPDRFFIVNDVLNKIQYTLSKIEISCIGTKWDGTEFPSSRSILFFNQDTFQIKNIYWKDAENIPENETWIAFGSIKLYGGRIQIHGTFPYRILGEFSKDDVIQRNQDISVVVDAATSQRFAFIHSSDTHADSERNLNIISYMNNKKNILGMFNTGDVQNDNFTTDINWLIDSQNITNKFICLTIGNHEVGNTWDVSLGGTSQQVYEKFIQPLEAKSGMITNGKNYWYKDFDDFGIRVISIYEYDDPNDLNPIDSSKWKVYRGRRVLSQEQINWFIQTLNSTPSDYGVIMLTHQNPSFNDEELLKEDKWTNMPIVFDPQNYINGNPLNDIIEAWRTGGYINETYSFFGEAAYLAQIVVDFDFSTRGVGEFISWFFGHSHNDGMGTFVNYPNQRWVAICPTAVYENRNTSNDLPRIENQKSEDAFNVVSVDRELRKVFVVRVGSNMNKNFVQRSFITFDY